MIFLKKFFGKEREKALADIIHELLDAIRDDKVDAREIKELRKKAYEILVNFGLDKKKFNDE